jgi:5'-3' exonuclease
MKVLIDADMIAHEVGHLREKIGVDEEDNTIFGELLNDNLMCEIAQGRLMSIIMGSQSGGWKAFLTSGKTFRDSIATILPYKGNREHAPRDKVDVIKEYLASLPNVFVVKGKEADDALATEMWTDLVDVGSSISWEDEDLRQYSNTVIASRDKDLDTVPGWHYKWWLPGAKKDGVEIPEEQRKAEKGEGYWVTVIQAFRNFYKQLLTGDSADNIKGLYGVGPKSAWIKQLDDIEDETEMYDHVEEKYYKFFGPHYGRQFLTENANLLHMQRRVDDQWMSPYERDEHYWYL